MLTIIDGPQLDCPSHVMKQYRDEIDDAEASSDDVIS